MPFVVIIYVWMLGLLFYQYDRALLEQDAVMLLVTGGEESSWDRSKYMWCDVEPMAATKSGGKQEIVLEAKFTGPYFKDLTTKCSHYVIDEVVLLRQKRKLDNWIGEKENG